MVTMLLRDHDLQSSYAVLGRQQVWVGSGDPCLRSDMIPIEETHCAFVRHISEPARGDEQVQRLEGPRCH